MQPLSNRRRPVGTKCASEPLLRRAMFLVWVLVSCLNDSCSEGPPALVEGPSRHAGDVLVGDCLPGSEVRSLCQNCAALVKAHKAYRMCCTDDAGNSTESVRAYCARLLDHTVGAVVDRLFTKSRRNAPPVR